ncbi:hypothetical protein V5O48_005419 [Marasmius crinis-equi]|uniref:Carboxylesterase type B domain-containing protein n=1 Tax=Marasmius crinis-equi TaxID=585013 RepID=A0ABR3FN12_9AGAR
MPPLRNLSLLLLVFSPYVYAAKCPLAKPPTIKDTKSNITYHGVISKQGDIEHFYDIPYGQARRFSNPEPYRFAQGIKQYNATKPGPICPQPETPLFGFMEPTPIKRQSEDCLRLRIARPARKEKEKLPVMVFIHGGGNINGHIYDRTYNPEGLIRQSVANGKPVMYVAMNYRLSIFGFPVTDVLRRTNSLNLALKDQRLALEWVKEHIAYFGGDPERVTLFGQNTGALSVTHQIIAYGGTKPVPFQAAIMESSALEPTSGSEITAEAFSGVAQLAGCSHRSPEAVECLRALSFPRLMNLTIQQHDSTASQNDGDTYLPTAQGPGAFVPDIGSELVRQGKFAKMPIVIGWTEDDASMFVHPSIKTPEDTKDFLYTDLLGGVRNDTLEELLSLYPISEFSARGNEELSAEFYRASQVFRDIFLVCPPFYFGWAMAQKYRASNSSSAPPVYYYHHNQTVFGAYLASEYPDYGAGLGVVYTSELPYVFGDLENWNATKQVHPTAVDLELARRQSRAWSGFASGVRPWERAYSKETGKGMMNAKLYVFGGPDGGISALDGEEAKKAVRRQRLRERCEFSNRKDVIEQLKY